MENLKVKTPPDHDIRLIAIPEENLWGKKMVDIENLETENEIFKVKTYFEVLKGQPFSSLMLLAVGKEMDVNEVWSVYRKSSKIFFCVCQKSSCNIK